MKNMNRKQVRILYVETIEINIFDIPHALDEIGYNVYKASLNISAQEYSKKACQTVVTVIEKYQIQYVISYDFSESIAQACFETEIPYISWVYDTPQRELYTHYALYPCNYIFVFDKKQKERLREIGIKNVYYMPLAIMSNKIELMLKDINREKELPDITFVGQLYKVDNLDNIMERAEEKIHQSMEKNIEECFLRWDENTNLHGKMEDICVSYFSLVDHRNVPKKYPYMSEQFYYEAAVTSRLIANKERIKILNTLAEKYNVRLYTDCEGIEKLSKNVKIFPGVKYDKISKIYYNSKININITLHCIESGVPQRVFDVMAAGGFMLSNYQKELEELFVPGEEIVLYHNLEELEKLTEYYLTHEEERIRIAENGKKKVLKYHDLHDRMDMVMKFVIEKEQKRTKIYSVLQKEWMYEKINNLLAKKQDRYYHKLYDLLKSILNTEDVPKLDNLIWLQEMLDCWKIESEKGTSYIFFNIGSIEEAENKYLFMKHSLWRIANEFIEDSCREDVYRMCKNQESPLLIAWMIKAYMQEWEKVFITVSEYMQEYNIVDAIKLLSYGLIYFPQNKKMLLKKEECIKKLKITLNHK